jgi:ribose 1,5-bisphosphokinase
MTAQTKIFYLIGASGAGKDTILNAYRQQGISSNEKLVIAHRYITRVNTFATGDEDFISLSNQEFTFRQEHRLFALDWQANGCRYGIGIEIDAWLNSGLSIIINGSRSYLLEARKKYSKYLISIEVEVSEEVLRQRLMARQRESLEEIEARIMRHRQLRDTVKIDESIRNLTSVSDAVDSLDKIVKKYGGKNI